MIGAQPLDQLHEAPGAVRIEPCGRLVEDQQRPGRARARERDALHHSARKVRRQQRPVVRRELHFRELRMHDRTDLLLETPPRSRSGNATLSNTVSAEKSAPFWNSIPMRRRASRTFLKLGSCHDTLNTRTEPATGCFNPRITLSSCVLPLPDPPTSVITSSRRTLRFRFWCRTWPAPTALTRPSTSIAYARGQPTLRNRIAKIASRMMTQVIDATTEPVTPAARLSVFGSTLSP